jgi:hypothetical protein
MHCKYSPRLSSLWRQLVSRYPSVKGLLCTRFNQRNYLNYHWPLALGKVTFLRLRVSVRQASIMCLRMRQLLILSGSKNCGLPRVRALKSLVAGAWLWRTGWCVHERLVQMIIRVVIQQRLRRFSSIPNALFSTQWSFYDWLSQAARNIT